MALPYRGSSLGAGRLEDKSSIVRKAALQLLAALLLYNPFGGELPEGRFEASLTEWRAKLQVIHTPLPMALPDGFHLPCRNPSTWWTGRWPSPLQPLKPIHFLLLLTISRAMSTDREIHIAGAGAARA